MASLLHNFKCRNCGGTKAKDSGDGMLHCTTCGMQTPAESIHQNSGESSPKRSPATATPRTGLSWKMLLYLPILYTLGLMGYNLVQSIRAGAFKNGISNIFSSSGKDYTWTSNDQGVYVGKDGSPGMFVIGERRTNGSRAASPFNGPYLIFFSLPDYKKALSQKLDLPPLRDKWVRFEVRPAGKGFFYVLLSEERLFLLNATNYSLQDITRKVGAHPGLAGGMGKIKTYSRVQTAAFEVETATGEKVYYDAPADRVYAKLSDIPSQAVTGLHPDTGVGFAFSQPNSSYPKAPTLLLRYVAVKPGSIVATPPYFSWRTAPGKSASNKETKPVLEPSATVRSFEEFGPEAPYYNGRVLYWDSDIVMIVSTAAPNPRSPQTVQSLNARTGVVLFTLPLLNAGYITNVVRFKGGFLLKDVGFVFMVGPNGKLVKEFRI